MNRWPSWGWIAAAIAAVAVVLMPADAMAQGCAMCKTYLSANDPRAEGMRVSILFLMSMPFALVGSVGGWIVWMYRRGRSRQGASRLLHLEREGVS
jgi:hypothetical protein